MCLAPETTRVTPFLVQVCVPPLWTDSQITAFAESDNEHPQGYKWGIYPGKEGQSTRIACRTRAGYVHALLELLED